jgi:tetratricopeptide (TPR) repeat protein
MTLASMNKIKTQITSQIGKAKTPAEQLRDLLARLEAEVGKLGYSDSPRSIDILYLLDRASELLAALSDNGAVLSAERGRFGTVTDQFRKKGPKFLKAVGGARALERLRDAEKPTRDRWWWYLDQELAAERSARRRQTLRSASIAAVVLAVLTGLYLLFLAPDEATRERYRLEQDAERALTEGRPDDAVLAADQALDLLPGDVDLLILKGIALELAARESEADLVFDTAQALLGNTEAFLSSRAQTYMLANRPDLALEDTEKMVARDKNSAVGYFQRGNAHASLGNYLEAVSDYEKASELAREQDRTELEGMARVQLANLMMLMQAPPVESPTAAP